jgi:hypothetical protein
MTRSNALVAVRSAEAYSAINPFSLNIRRHGEFEEIKEPLSQELVSWTQHHDVLHYPVMIIYP